MDLLLYMNKAISKTGTVAYGTEFVLKDLFDGIEWNNLTDGEKRDFGRNFKYEVGKGHIPNIVYIGKAQNNSSKYRKE